MGPRRKPQWLKMVKNIFVKRIVSHSRRHHNQLKFFKKIRSVQKRETQEPNPRVTREGRKAEAVYKYKKQRRNQLMVQQLKEVCGSHIHIHTPVGRRAFGRMGQN